MEIHIQQGKLEENIKERVFDIAILGVFKHSLINSTFPEIAQAVFYGIGYFYTGHIETVAVRFRVFEDRAHPVRVVEIIEGLLC